MNKLSQSILSRDFQGLAVFSHSPNKFRWIDSISYHLPYFSSLSIDIIFFFLIINLNTSSLFSGLFFLDRRQPSPIKSVLLIIIGWLVCWLVGNADFLEMALRVFVIFCMKLGDYKGRKVIEPDFWKNSWFRDIREKVSKLAKNQTLWYISQKRL